LHRVDSSRADQHDDGCLVARLAHGELEAAADLYDRYAALVFGLARRILRNDEDAEEVVQDVFSQAWRSARRFDARRGSVAGWLLVMARSRAIDRLRGRESRPLSAPGSDPDSMPSSDAGPTEQLTLNEEAGRLRAAVAALPAIQREALELAYFQGLTQSEIAERLAQPLGTIKTRIRSALGTLRERLLA
jgi:RNA polymerase sigma-70 factor (ECF subfamily)